MSKTGCNHYPYKPSECLACARYVIRCQDKDIESMQAQLFTTRERREISDGSLLRLRLWLQGGEKYKVFPLVSDAVTIKQEVEKLQEDLTATRKALATALWERGEWERNACDECRPKDEHEEDAGEPECEFDRLKAEQVRILALPVCNNCGNKQHPAASLPKEIFSKVKIDIHLCQPCIEELPLAAEPEVENEA